MDPEGYERLVELNAPQQILQAWDRKAGDKYAKGVYMLHWDAKTITINKDSVVDIDIY